MAEQTIQGRFEVPQMILDRSPAIVGITIDAASEKAAFVFRAPKTGTISKVAFRTETVTTGATVDVRLETVSTANGDPTGTLLGTNSNGSQVIADADDDTWFTTSLTTGVAVTRGDLMSAVIVNPAGSPGSMLIAELDDSLVFYGFPYGDAYTASWSKRTDYAIMAFEYDDGSYATVPQAFPVSNINSVAFNNTSDPDHRGLKFKLPFPFRLAGIWLLLDLDGDADIKLYDSDGTSVLATTSIDSNVRYTTSSKVLFVDFASPQSLSKDVSYRVVVEPTSATSVTLFDFDVNSAAVMDAFSGGQDFHHTEKKDAGWTDTTTKRPWIGLLIDGFDDGAGGSTSGARNPLGGPI